MPDNDGIDVLYVLIRRFVGGAARIYVEAIAKWTESDDQSYMSSWVSQAGQATMW